MIINVDALNRKMELPQFREGFKVWKISKDDAMRFTKAQAENLKQYPLRIGEHYIGYIMVDHGEGWIEICYLNGALVKVTRAKDLINPHSIVPPNMKEFEEMVRSGRFYKTVGGAGTYCKRVIMLAEQNYVPSVKHYQVIGWIDDKLDTEAIAKNLRDRMVESAVSEKIIYLADHEKDILTDHFGLDYYKLFKLSVWEDAQMYG